MRDKSQRSVPDPICTKLVKGKKKKKKKEEEEEKGRKKKEMCWSTNGKLLSAANHNQPLKKHTE